MSNLSKSQQDLLYWHAIAKMHQGSFAAAKHLFAYLFGHAANFQNGMAAAYCAYRDGDTPYAKAVLSTITPADLTQTKLLNRLSARLERA